MTREYGKRDPSSHRTPAQVHAMDHGYNRVHQDRIVDHHRVRRAFEREGKVRKGDGKDIAHKHAKALGGSDARSNLKVQDASKNRAWQKEGLK